MPSPADRFTRLQKIAIFLLVIGEQKARRLLADLDLETIERINVSIATLSDVTPQERGAVMIEFGELFFNGKPLQSKLTAPQVQPRRQPASVSPPVDKPQPVRPEEETTARTVLQHLERQVDPQQIDWSRAGYDFGEGFKGPPGRRC